MLPASERISTAKLAVVLDERRKAIQLAPEESLRSDYAEFEYGAVPPIGGAHADRVIVDTHVAEHDSVVLEAGLHDDSIRIATQDLIKLAAAEVADLRRRVGGPPRGGRPTRLSLWLTTASRATRAARRSRLP